MRVLYVLNAVGGGASLGIYEMLRQKPPFAAFAAIPDRAPESIRPLFEATEIVPLPWWNVLVEAGLARRAAFAASRWRNGFTTSSSVQAIRHLIGAWKVDLVHTGTSLNLGGALAAQQAGIPHVWHIKESVGSNGRVQFPMPDADLVAFFSRHSARVVAMSDYIGAIFRQQGCPNLAVIPDGVDPEPFRNGSSRRLRDQLGIGLDGLLVGMVAGLRGTWKRHDLFIQMAANLARRDNRTHFVIVGSRPSRSARWPYDLGRRYAERIEALAKDAVPPGRLRLLDHFPDPADIMRSLDVLVHPCDTEPFGRIAIEAMAAGTPVVGPATGGIAETVVHEQTGLLVPPGNAEALAEATARLLADPALRQRLGEAGRQRTRECFGIAQHRDAIVSLYQSVLRKQDEAQA